MIILSIRYVSLSPDGPTFKQIFERFATLSKNILQEGSVSENCWKAKISLR